MTDIVKQDFEKWFNSWFDKDYINTKLNITREETELGVFESLPESMCWGVYIRYFDYCGIHISINFENTKDYWYNIENERTYCAQSKRTRAGVVSRFTLLFTKRNEFRE